MKATTIMEAANKVPIFGPLGYTSLSLTKKFFPAPLGLGKKTFWTRLAREPSDKNSFPRWHRWEGIFMPGRNL